MKEIQKYNKIIVGNWKLNGSISFIKLYLNNLRYKTNHNNTNLTVICPPYPFINQLLSQKFSVGAQDCSIYKQGSYTGETSAKMLKDAGCEFCLIGHSERRNIFGDTDEIISKKVSRCLEENIIPILCIGENFEQNKRNETKKVLINQINKGVPEGSSKNNLIIAYEPVWAIGTGHTPTLKEIDDIQTFIKNKIPKSKNYQLLYGGSVKSTNYKEILSLNSVDGILVGGSSLSLDEFNKILSL